MNTKDSFVVRVDFVQKPEDRLAAYAFDATGTLVAQAPIDDGEARLPLTPRRALASRLFIAPELPDDFGEPTPAAMERIGAYEPALRPEKPGSPVARVRIPADILERLRLCFCLVRGRVVRDERPVCGARVHICEVDRWPRFVYRLPDSDVLRLRDDLLRALAERPRLPEPEPRPDPPPFDIPIRSPLRTGRVVAPGSRVGFNPQPEPPARWLRRGGTAAPGSEVAFNPQPEPPAIELSDRPPLAPAGVHALARRAASASLSSDALAALSSASPSVVRRGLVDQVQLVLPFLCWWPWWWWRYRCDELRVIETDPAGRFSTLLLYACDGDKPDLYFWVEYEINGVWETVYRPPIACHTHWNYVCGTEVTLSVTDPRVPVCDDEPDLAGLQVAVMSIGNGVSMSEINGPGAPPAEEGLTTGGRPFGGRLEPRVWFSRSGLIAAGITHYRWSYRRLTRPDGTTPDLGMWTPMSRTVIRHYSVVGPTGDLSFPPYPLGPNDAGLFEIKPIDPPDPGIDWFVLDAREDTASAFFQTTELPHSLVDPSTECEQAEETSGKYELKLELFRDSGSGFDRIDDWEAEGIALKVADVPAPFGAGTATTIDAPGYYRLVEAGQTAGFRTVLRVDNGCCRADVQPISGPGLSVDANCGFVEYAPGASVDVRYVAAHPRGFATVSFRTTRGTSTTVSEATTYGRVDDASTPTGASADSVPPSPGPFVRSGDTFAKTLPVGTLLTSNTPPGATPCDRAAFAQTLYVRALATDGWSRLSGLDRSDVAAFALDTPCDC